MFTIILCTIVVAVLFYYYIVKPFDYWKKRGVKQGNPKWIFGDQWGQVCGKQNSIEMIDDIYYQSPGSRYFGMYQFSTPRLLIRDPDLIKQLTVKDFDHFTDHQSFLPEDGDPLLTKNLFGLKGQKWRDMRATLSPSFTTSKMKAIFMLIQDCAEHLVQHFSKKGDDIIELDMKDTFTRFANDVIATAAFGIKVDSLDEPNNEFFLMGKDLTDFTGFWKSVRIFLITMFPNIASKLNLKLMSNNVTEYFYDLINSTLQTREKQGIVRPDMINLLMEAQKGTQRPDAHESETVKGKPPMNITNEDIVSQALIFFLAGFDTVSTSLCFISHEIAVNPDIQDRLREEILETLDECGGNLTYEVLTKMKYMDMVISEGLRKWPFPILTERVCTKPYTIEPTLPGETPVDLVEGDGIWLPTISLHHDPEYFPDPDRFDPERFNDDNKGNIKPYTYFPFGLGPRNCIGSRFALMEMKAVLFYILQNFELVPVEKTTIPLVVSRKKITPGPDGGFWLGFKRIKR